LDHTGILLINLGSPESPAEPDVRKYLDEFLMDARVLDYAYPLRRFIVSAFILPSRPKFSAQAYRTIWWQEGSPLIVISKRVQAALQQVLDVPVALAMRYGNPSIHAGLKELFDQGIRNIFVIPMYPHYAMSTYETVVVETRKFASKKFPGLSLSFMPPFYNNPAYINALFQSALPYLNHDFDHLLFSYHGIPERHLRKTDPTHSHCLSTKDCCTVLSPAAPTCYRHQVLETTRLFVTQTGIHRDNYSVSFQSRLGKDVWLQPYTEAELINLAKLGKRRLMVICPAFTADCLETLEEIGERGRTTFLEAGGKEYFLIPCLNDHPTWINTLREWCETGIRRGDSISPAFKNS
jgi:protoporphyrin/coproporphyrin ferrochelatase